MNLESKDHDFSSKSGKTHSKKITWNRLNIKLFTQYYQYWVNNF